MLSRSHILLKLQLEGMEQLLGGVLFVPDTGQDIYWSTMHSSAAVKLWNQRVKHAAGTSLQRALEGMLAYFWAHQDPNTNGYRTATLVQRARVQHEADSEKLQWIALRDKVLQDAVLQHQGIVCTELTQLGYMLSFSYTENCRTLKSPISNQSMDIATFATKCIAGFAVYLAII